MKQEEILYNCKAYACYLKNEEKLLKSTSGGIFQGIAEMIIEQGGIVFGAAFTDDFEIQHQETHTIEELGKILKSKYAQSRIGDCYIRVREYLQKGKLVLFSGTPCQIAGLKSFLGKEYDTLLTVDLICHGVPSNKLFQEHINFLNKKYGKIYEFQFRDKQNGWDEVSVSYKLKNGKKIMKAWEDAYFYGFDHYYFLRPCCYECDYRKMRSGSDLTLGDYWGIKDQHPDFWNEKGISAVIVKSAKGEKAFEKLKERIIWIDTSVKKIANYNVFVFSSVGKKVDRKRFYDLWKNGEKNLSRIYKLIEQPEQSLKIGVIGGYASRKATICCNKYDSGIQLGWHIANSCVSSMVAPVPEKPMDIADFALSNEYRKQSIKNDINKLLLHYLNQKNDYIIIDFLEERFPVLYLENGLTITDSEAFSEIEDMFPLQTHERLTMLQLPVHEWEKNCLAFIKILKNYMRPEQIILNCTYLTEKYGGEEPEEIFDNLKEIREINKRLKKYYQFFAENYEGIHVVDIQDANTDFCDKYFNLGCEPVNFNMARYRQMRDKIIEITEV